MLPESHTAVSEVTVWVVAAVVFVHVTVSPTVMLVTAGVNAKSLMATEALAALAVPKPTAAHPPITATARTMAATMILILSARTGFSLLRKCTTRERGAAQNYAV